jgi:lipopolysaccharide/colanic/teichoic acid biosynthesis glycosyltransferase
MLKFRSMVRSAAAHGSYMTGSNDPRITRIGRVIRRASLDELPQLLNILKGEMSLVGPRPDVPAQRADYSEADWRERCSVRPGLTGLAQARLRSQATAAERLALGLQYVRQHGIALDLKILVWTLARLGGMGSN